MSASESTRVQVLHRAAQVLGGKAKLREHLRVGMRELEAWLIGLEKVPTQIFLAAVDVVSEGSKAPREAVAARRLGTSASDFLRMEFTRGKILHMLELALNAAANETRAPRGNIQLARPEGLRIVSQL